MVTVGIDLRASPKRASTVVALDCRPGLAFTDRFRDDDEFVRMAQAHQPEVIAIGAPLGLPAGLCCLESSCECELKVPQRKGREAELQLSRMGISCFFTSKGSIISGLIYRGIELSRRLSGLGFQVVEVYPHATKVMLFGDRVPPKNSAASLAFLRERLSPLIHGLDDDLSGFDRNTCAAVLNAYTAFLHKEDATDVLGNPEEGTVVLPRLPR